MVDVAIIGAGPAGLACAIETKRRALTHRLIDKGCVVNSIARFPTHLVFFTTPELLEIGDLPLVCAQEKPTRIEVLKYYRRVVETYQLHVQAYETVLSVHGHDGKWVVETNDRWNESHAYTARKVIVATGYYDHPNWLNIPGENLPKVSHYYTEAHPFFDQDVAVIGGKNSAIEAALELYRSGARVTMIYRGSQFNEKSVKYWIRPDIENRIQRGEIAMHWNSVATEIKPKSIVFRNTQGTQEIKNDFVFALTGYRPDFDLLKSLGIRLVGEDLRPAMSPQTYESNVPGIYLAGSVVAGLKNGEIFIENGRFHGKAIADDLARKLRGQEAERFQHAG